MKVMAILYYYIEPEVAGGLGCNTMMDRSSHPPIVSRLHYKFDGWLDDELLETFPCYIITKRLWKVIQDEEFTGVESAPVEISLSEVFQELYPNRKVPDFVWLKVSGKAGIDDFGITSDNRLVVSERVLNLLGLKYCLVVPFENP